MERRNVITAVDALKCAIFETSMKMFILITEQFCREGNLSLFLKQYQFMPYLKVTAPTSLVTERGTVSVK